MEHPKHQPFQIALVALDLTKMDEHLIRYASMLCKLLSLERLFFLHVAKDLELPEELLEKYPTLMAPLDESLQADIMKKVMKHFKNIKTDVECVVKDGPPIEKILKFAKVKAVDLILMGRKKSLEGSGLVSSHIARKCPSSLLLVPEISKPKIKKVLVAVDFSGHSAIALNHALALVNDAPKQVELMHSYTVPPGYTKIGKTYEEFDEIIKGHAQRECREFLKKHQFPKEIRCAYFSSGPESKEEAIHNHAVECGADMILVGSRGRTATSSILMGSLAEKLVLLESEIPVLIVKKKGENMGFIEAMLRI